MKWIEFNHRLINLNHIAQIYYCKNDISTKVLKETKGYFGISLEDHEYKITGQEYLVILEAYTIKQTEKFKTEQEAKKRASEIKSFIKSKKVIL